MRFKVPKTLDPSTREEILNVAQKVFAEIGFKEATVRQICKAAKANVCLISYYFGGKDGLYKSVFERTTQVRVEQLRSLLGNPAAIATHEEYRLRFQLLLEGINKQISLNPDFFKLMQREMIDGMPRAESVIKPFIALTHQMLSNFIDAGQKAKYVKRDLDTQVATLCIINMFVGALAQQHTDVSFFFKGINPKDIPEIVIKTVSQIFFEGVLQ